MRITEPLPLHHSWPLFEADVRLALGRDAAGIDPGALPWTANGWGREDRLAARGLGLWDCDLADQSLRWTAGVYDLFGIPRGERVERPLAVSIYAPRSRGAMEELRAHALRFRRGFTVDVELRQPSGDTRWMRLSAVPVLRDDKPVRLRGMKRDVTAEYDIR